MSAAAVDSLSDGVFRQLLEGMSEGVSLATEAGIIVYTNPAQDRMFGYAPGELVGQHVSVLNAYPPDENARLVGEVIETLRSEGRWRGEWRNRRKDHAEFVTSSRISAVEVDGRTHWLSVQEDITEQRRAEALVRDSEARLELATAAAQIGVWDWELASSEMVYSDRAKAIYGFPPQASVTFEMVRDATHPKDLPNTLAQLQRALDPAVRDNSPYEYRILRPDGQTRWVRACGEAVFEGGADGPRAVRYVGTVEDVTEQKRVEEELRRSQARLSLAIDAGRMAVWSFDARSEEFLRTPEFNRVLGFPEDANPTLDEIRARYAPGELERLRVAAQAAMAAGQHSIELEFRYLWPGGRVRWLLLRAEMVYGRRGTPASAIGVIIDITERKEAEERLKLLAREVDHRANNLLTVVQATVKLTHASSAQALKEILAGRISALAHAHQLLAQARWEGADLRELVEEELRPFQYGQAGRTRLEGPPVALRPQAAQSVAMAMHELATNAAKYGALSRPTGGVEVTWRGGRDGEPLVLVWRESGGPPVEPPAKRGLGMTVVQRAVGGALQGRAGFDWRPEGLTCELTMTLQPAGLAPAGES
jgi:PAS domain S-box-containing protein